MQNNPWKKELLYGLMFLALALLSSWLSNFWAASFLLWSLIYIFWKWVELYYFQNWYKNGADARNIPFNSGIWQVFSNQVVVHNKGHAKVEKKNKFLLNQFNSTAQSLPYATILLNKKYEVVWINQASQAILGIVENKDEGKKIAKLIQSPQFNSVLKNNDKTQELNIPHPLDNDRKVHIRLVKLSNKRSLLVARDISEQESLRNSRKAFVANASHELRTPLTVISGYLEMLQNSQDIPKQWNVAIDQAIMQSDRMENIIDDMLKLSSIEHEHYLESRHALIKMPELLNRLFNDVKNSSKAKHHTFVANIDSQLCINGNQEEVISICLNLLNNAVVHANPHTKQHTEISLRWFSQDDKACLWVCDNGEGIEQKHLNHLTERFYRVDNSCNKNTNSTGLGLAIVKQICDNHGATLEVESEFEKGTCFKVEFPSSVLLNKNETIVQ